MYSSVRYQNVESCPHSVINRAETVSSLCTRATARAEVTYGNGLAHSKKGPNCVNMVPQINSPKIEESATTTPSVIILSAPFADSPSTETPKQDMSASKTLVPSDLTMDKNPMTTAEPSSIDHIDKDTANLIGKAVAEPSQENPSPSETVTAGRYL